jgi:hypothetical protein
VKRLDDIKMHATTVKRLDDIKMHATTVKKKNLLGVVNI